MKGFTASRAYMLIYVIALLEMVFFVWQISVHGNETADSFSYYRAFRTILSGQPDAERTPLYPLFVGCVKALFGSGGLYVIATLQSLLYLCSISWFRKLAEGFLDNPRLAFFLTAVYALSPGILQFNCMVMTDVPSLAGMTALLWLTFEAYNRRELRPAIGSGVVMILLMATRPVFLFLPFLFGLFWLLSVFKHTVRRVARVGLGMCCVAFALAGWYGYEINRLYGMKSATLISSYNNYCTVREAGVIKLEEIRNPKVAALMDSILTLRPEAGTLEDTWSERKALETKLEPSEFDGWIRDEMKLHHRRLLQYLRNERLSKVLPWPGLFVGCYAYPHLYYVLKLFSITFSTAFFIVAAFCLVVFLGDIRRRGISCYRWLLAGLYICMASVTIAGAENDWDRLMLPATSAFLLVAGSLFLSCARFFLRK